MIRIGDTTWQYEPSVGWHNDEDDPAMTTETAMLDLITAIDALHCMTESVYPPQCAHCWKRWPCPTHLLIHPETRP